MKNASANRHEPPKFSKTVWEDFRRPDIRRSLRKDLREIKDFYLDSQRRERLQGMHRLKRWMLTSWWLLKEMFFRLTALRRVLFILGIVFILISGNTGEDSRNVAFIGATLLVIILMLELKDKLLARDELETGRRIQQALMPEPSPPVPGWDVWLFTRPANEVGGDLVDFMQINSDQYSISVGDVAGKGLGAALFMARLHATLHALLPDFQSLAELGSKINQIFYRDRMPDRFASLLSLQLESASGRIRILNAGHIPPLVVRRNALEELPKGSPALGLAATSFYQEQEVELNPGEFLIVYSDGITEARNEAQEFFGEQRLRDILKQATGLSAQELGEHIVESVDRFKGEGKAFDDLSLVVLKRC
ncbi:MAG: hypothetical protein Kow0042_29190 [Calditrichia bacterium]